MNPHTSQRSHQVTKEGSIVTTVRSPRTDRLRLVALLVMVALLAACATPDVPADDRPGPDSLPGPDDLARASASPEKWRALSAKCPILQSTTANSLGVAGPGYPTPTYIDAGIFFYADCAWDSTDVRGLSVKARVNISGVQDAIDKVWAIHKVARSGQVPGVGDDAIKTSLPYTVGLYALSKNVIVLVQIVPPSSSGLDHTDLDSRLRELEPAVPELARDVLDDLR